MQNFLNSARDAAGKAQAKIKEEAAKAQQKLEQIDFEKIKEQAGKAAHQAGKAAQQAGKAAKHAASKAQEEAQKIDLHSIQKKAQDLGSTIQKKAANVASDLMDRATSREVVTVEGQSLYLLKTLGEGGFGFVYLARHTESGKEYAVKRMIGQDRESTALATAELELLKTLQHPNIVKLHASCSVPRDAGDTDFLLVMELAELVFC